MDDPRMVLLGATRIRSGPYRFVDHPNYLIVCGEIAVVPLMFGAGALAVVGSVLNLLPRPQPAAETPRADR